MTSPFELLRFEATPVAPAVAVVELDGVFAGAPPSRPRLLVETGGVEREMPALSAGGSPWSGVFAVPLEALSDPDARFSLVPGRGPLIALPSPSESGGDDDRFVRLARTANDLRHRLGQATADAEDLATERDRLTAELGEVRDRLAAAEARADESHAAALSAREEQARAEGEADEARAAAERAREEATAAVERAREEAQTAADDAAAAAQEELDRAIDEAEAARAALASLQARVVAAEDEARSARADLEDARARLESLVRENRTARIAAARAHVPSATPDDDDAEFHAARLGAEWAEGADEEGEGSDPTEPVADPSAAATDPTEPLGDSTDSLPVPPSTAPTEQFEPAGDSAAHLEPAGDAPTTAHLEPVEPGAPELWRDEDDDESVRVLRPRTNAGRLRPAKAPDLEEDDEVDEDDLDLAPVDPAGALSPVQQVLAILTNPRVIVGGIFLALILALVLIFNGVGLV